MRLVMTCPEPQIVALDHESAIGRAALIDLEVDLDRLEMVTDVTGHGGDLRNQLFFQVHQLCVLAHSSASRREASEMSVIRRSSRRTSCWITSNRRWRDSSLRASGQGLDRAAQREFSGFFNSWLTYGGEALDGFDAGIKRVGHFAKRDRQIADLILSGRRNSGDFLPVLDRTPHPHGGGRQPPQRCWRSSMRAAATRMAVTMAATAKTRKMA